MELASAQDQVDSAGPNSRVALTGGDYGPLVINQSVTLDCNGASVWGGRDAPSILIRARNVVVENAVLRAWEKPADGSWPVVLDIDAKAGAHFRNVKLAGAVRGFGAESGPWVVPGQFELGVIATSEARFSLEFAVPVSCRLTSRVQGVDFDPPALAPGINVVHLKVADVPRDTILWGIVELSSDQFVRLLPLHGRVAVATPGKTSETVKLHHLTKVQAAAFNQALHPAPPPAAKPHEKPPVKLPLAPKPSEPAPEEKRVLPKAPTTLPVTRSVLEVIPPGAGAPATAPGARREEAPKTPLSSIFSAQEPELPALVVQPELPATPASGTLFQPAPAPEGLTPVDEAKAKDLETEKAEPHAPDSKPLLSKLFKPDPP